MILGIDVSHFQDKPLPWAEWAGRVSVVCIQTYHGDHVEPLADVHLANALVAGYSHIGAYALLWPGQTAEQAAAFIRTLKSAHTWAALDVEVAGLVGTDVLNWCTYFSANCSLSLVLYGNNQLAAIIAAYPELKRYGVWYAGYPTFPNLCTVPPFPQPRNVPASLAERVVGWQYAGDNGRLPPYTGAIDLTTWYEIPGATPMPTLSPGAGHGFHGEQTNQIIPLIQRGLAIGVRYKLLNSVENPGRCKDAHDLLPEMATISRFKFPPTAIGERWENGQDVEQWTEDEHLACARAQIQILFDRTNPTERAGIKFYTPGINEWNLSGDQADWTCVGHHLQLMMDEAERRSSEFGQVIRLAVPGISQGKPQYWQMKQVIATGCFDRMAARGDLFTVHEGRYRWETGDPIPGLGDVIPQAPRCPPYGGSGTGRINYWYDLGITCDFAVTECYDGWSSEADPAVRLFRMKQTDDLYRHNPHYRGTAWFEFVDNDDSQWRDTDFTPTVRANVFEAEMIAQANVPNPTGDESMPITKAQKDQFLADLDTATARISSTRSAIAMLVPDDLPLYHAKVLQGVRVRDTAGNQLVPDLVLTIGSEVDVYRENVTAGVYTNRAVINPNGNNVVMVNNGAPTLQKI